MLKTTLKIIFATSILIFQTSCSTMATMNVVNSLDNPNAPQFYTQVEVFKSPDQIPTQYEVIGQVSVSDTGFSVDCGFSSMVKSIQEKAVVAKADGAYFKEIRPPSVWSTCYQGTADLIVYKNGEASNNRTSSKSDGPSSGSGFLIDSDGRVATNFHVIEGKNSFRISLGETATDYNAVVIASDKANDIAILKIDDKKWKKIKQLPYKFKSSNGVSIGEDVFTMGFPLGQMLGTSIRLTKGSISSKAGILDDIRMFQMTTAIQPGNSGGPLIDMNGNIVGIVVATLSPEMMLKYTGSLPQNINFAIKIDYLLSLAEMNDITLTRASKAMNSPMQVSGLAQKVNPFVARIVAN